MRSLRDERGPLVPGDLLGRGGEGEVFALAGETCRAIKLYSKPDGDREAKIRAMVAADLTAAHAAVAFPETVAFDKRGRFAGFTMRLVRGGQPVHEVYAPASRRRAFPGADWRFLVRVATNIAASMGRIHLAGAVVGDVNGSGILVSSGAVPTFIDADSFQFGPDHPCRVGVPEFTPGELQGRSLDRVKRTRDHDAFGLAVMIFHLLMLGRHPFAGVPVGRDVPLTEAIRLNAFAYSRLRRVRLTPPRRAPLLSDLPLEVANMFERAFSGVVRRPPPDEWYAALARMEAEVVPCGRNPSHWTVPSGGCSWCRIDQQTGSPTFAAAPRARAAQVGTTTVAPAAVARLLERARTEAGESLRPAIARTGREPSDDAPPKAGGGPRTIDAGAAAKLRCRAQRRLDAAIDDWRTRMGAWSAARLAAVLTAELDRHRETARRHAAEVAGIEERLRTAMVGLEMTRRRLSPADVAGIGARGIARLHSAGIVSAADLTAEAVSRVGGIGQRGAATLMLWREGIRAGLQRTTKPSRVDVDAAITASRESRRRERIVEMAELARLAADLERALDEMADRAQAPDPRVAEAAALLRRAEAELRVLPETRSPAAPSPAVPTVAVSSPPPSAPASGRSGPRRAACPNCGGPMVRRWARQGPSPDRYFLGCAAYPKCTGSRPLRSKRP